MRGAHLYVDPELATLLPALTKDQQSELEKMLVESKKLGREIDSIKVANIKGEKKRPICDGMHRYPILLKHNIDYTIDEMEFESRADCMMWMYRFQSARRNMTAAALKVVRGTVYNARKKQSGDTKPVGTQEPKNLAGHDVPQVDSARHETSSAVAAEFGVNEKTIRRDGEFVERIYKELPIQLQKAYESGELKATTEELEQLVQFEHSSQNAIAADVRRNGTTWRQALESQGCRFGKTKSKPAPSKKKEEKPTDQKGEELPSKLLPVWEERKKLVGIHRKIGELRNELIEICNGVAGGYLADSEINADFRNLQSIVKFAYPHRVCKCKAKKRDCVHCDGRGWVNQDQSRWVEK